MTAVGTVVLQDIPPFVMAAGNTASPFGINAEGLKRRGFSPAALLALKRAYRTLYKSGLMLEEARGKLAEDVIEHPEIQPLIDFLAVSKRGIIR
jgi:UDP-N-acetylglucosamine acyltransferase